MTLGMEGFGLAGFLYIQDLAALVVTTFRAGSVRHLALVTIGALGQRVGGQCVVRATDAGASFRVSPFWIRHSIPLLFSSRLNFTNAGFSRILDSFAILTVKPLPRSITKPSISTFPSCNFVSFVVHALSLTIPCSRQLSSLPRISFSADQRGSSRGSAQPHCCTFRFLPQ